MFINFSNHTSENWSIKQIEEANKYGEIFDLPFPDIDPLASKEDLIILVDHYSNKISSLNDVKAVMVQGEMCFTFMMVQKLKELGIKAVCACSKRETIEKVDEHGKSVKIATFNFVQFREY